MKVQLTIEVDGTEDYCEQWISELETVVAGNEGIRIHSGGGVLDADLLTVQEQPAVGRARKGAS